MLLAADSNRSNGLNDLTNGWPDAPKLHALVNSPEEDHESSLQPLRCLRARPASARAPPSPRLAQTPDASRFPTKPIRLIVPFPPGGSNDILGRFIAQKLSERLGQQTIVDNRAGADGIIGTRARRPARPPTVTRSS